MKIRLEVSGMQFTISLRDTPTAQAIIAALPFESRAQTWGEEVYFTTPVNVSLEPDARQVVAPGTVCFWTEGDALALPFGRTPMSTDERPKLASRCNVLGEIAGDAKLLSRVESGDKVTLSKA
jgi:hypothetical protein